LQRGVKMGHVKSWEPVKRNPRGTTGKFERCVEAVSKRGGAYDPRAVCAAQERREIGQRELTRRAVAGKKRAARGNPDDLIAPYVPDPPRPLAKKYGPHWRDRADATELQREYNREAAARAKALKAYRAYVAESNRRYYARHGNPADTAAEAYERFHGEPPTEFVTVTRKIHYHGHLFSVGNLVALVVRTIDRESEVKLKQFRGAFLAANEQAFKDLARTGRARAQLFIEDGDQSINLEDFGIDPERSHEVETLGRIVRVDYETTKVHLGSEGGHAVYEHKFKTTREGDAEVKVDWARYPDLIYRVLDEHLEFSGGSYELIAEGINL
jgi:hypothetical protein